MFYAFYPTGYSTVKLLVIRTYEICSKRKFFNYNLTVVRVNCVGIIRDDYREKKFPIILKILDKYT